MKAAAALRVPVGGMSRSSRFLFLPGDDDNENPPGEVGEMRKAVNEGVDLSVFPFSQASFFQRDSEVVDSS